jgi:hypothetical protein
MTFVWEEVAFVGLIAIFVLCVVWVVVPVVREQRKRRR